MKTSYFTLGFQHVHSMNGHTCDRNTIIKITHENPRDRMIELCGLKWAFEYSSLSELKTEYYNEIYEPDTSNLELIKL